jgi:hypothetical protein
MKSLIFTLILVTTNAVYGQPVITEDRFYLKISADVTKVQQDIYQPNFPGKTPVQFIRWEYVYRNGMILNEKSFRPANGLTFAEPTEKFFIYSDRGVLIRDSCIAPGYPRLDYITVYQHNQRGQLTKMIETNTVRKKVERVNTFKNYNGVKTYQVVSQFFADDDKKSLRYTSVFVNGFKQQVFFDKAFVPIIYQYDDKGFLIAKNNRKYFYKLDERGNPIAVVEIERGMRIYNFISLTYTDGLVTGGLHADEDFIKKWDSWK